MDSSQELSPRTPEEDSKAGVADFDAVIGEELEKEGVFDAGIEENAVSSEGKDVPVTSEVAAATRGPSSSFMSVQACSSWSDHLRQSPYSEQSRHTYRRPVNSSALFTAHS